MSTCASENAVKVLCRNYAGQIEITSHNRATGSPIHTLRETVMNVCVGVTMGNSSARAENTTNTIPRRLHNVDRQGEIYTGYPDFLPNPVRL